MNPSLLTGLGDFVLFPLVVLSYSSINSQQCWGKTQFAVKNPTNLVVFFVNRVPQVLYLSSPVTTQSELFLMHWLYITDPLYQWLFNQLPWRKKRDTNLPVLASQELNILLSCSLSLNGSWLLISKLHAFKKPDDAHLSACWHCSIAKVFFSFSRTCSPYVMGFTIFQWFKPVFTALNFPHFLKLLFKDEDKN